MTLDLAHLNDAQRRSVLHSDEHLLVIAGPGSGKTRVLTHRIARLLDDGVKPWEILAVTFTNKAAAEMRERLERLVGDGTTRLLWAGTFHSVCARMLRFEAEAAGLGKNFQILDAQDAQRVVSSIVLDAGLAVDKKEATQLGREMRDRISYVKNTMQDPALDLDESELSLFRAYEDRLQKMGALDFDDLLLRALAFLRSSSEAAQRWRSRFRHVLVDEFQDTNAVQLAIVQLLAQQGLVTAVGDAAQSIYSWRGADHTVVTRFEALFNPASVIQLGENYRSTPQIVEVCQAILDAEPDAPYRLELSTGNAPGSKVRLRECDDERDEAAYVAAAIQRSRLPLSEHAILVRTAAQTRPIEDELMNRRIPYVVVGGLKFYERAEIRDAIAYLRAASYDCDVVSFARAVTVPRRGVGEKTVSEVVESALLIGDLRAALGSYAGRGAKGVQEMLAVLEQLRNHALEVGYVAAVQELVNTVLRPHFAKDPEGQTRIENLDQLVAAAAQFRSGITITGERVEELDGLSALLAFLEHVALVSAADEEKGSCVQLMTMHAAKGREFPHVFVTGLEEEILPHSRAKGSPADVSEERRLFYVACSRAKAELDLSHVRSRYLFGQSRDQARSRFVGDLSHLDLQRSSAPFRKAYWTDSHRSRPGGAGEWSKRFQKPAAPAPVRERRAASPAPGPRLSASEVTVGDVVNHPSFGDGTVVSLRGNEVRISFAEKERTLSLEMAPLSKK